MKTTLDIKKRVRDELLAAGFTAYGLRKSEAKSLYDHIGADEHILAGIYGQFESTSAMMVATDKRILFVDVRAMHNIVEESTYDSFGDLKVDEGIAYSKVTLRTKPREYVFRLVNRRCARRFLNVLEEMTQEQGSSKLPNVKRKAKNLAESVALPITATLDDIDFLHKHHTATLSTRTEDGYPYGATVFYFYDKQHPDYIYTVTKSITNTAKNLRKHKKVAFTVTDEHVMATMHILGEAEIEKQSDMTNHILGLLFTYGEKLSKASMPPVAQMKDGSFVVYRTRIKQVYIRSYLI